MISGAEKFGRKDLLLRRVNGDTQRNDSIAPEPGFSAAQLGRLALLYVGSVRRGKWLIPAFTACSALTPTTTRKNFDLQLWASRLQNPLNDLESSLTQETGGRKKKKNVRNVRLPDGSTHMVTGVGKNWLIEHSKIKAVRSSVGVTWPLPAFRTLGELLQETEYF